MCIVIQRKVKVGAPGKEIFGTSQMSWSYSIHTFHMIRGPSPSAPIYCWCLCISCLVVLPNHHHNPWPEPYYYRFVSYETVSVFQCCSCVQSEVGEVPIVCNDVTFLLLYTSCDIMWLVSKLGELCMHKIKSKLKTDNFRPSYWHLKLQNVMKHIGSCTAKKELLVCKNPITYDRSEPE